MISYKSIWKIAYPIMFGNLAQTIIALTDTAFLGRISEVALGASAMAGIYYYVFSTLAWGFALGVQVIIARRFGEKNYPRIGVIFEHGLVVVTMLGVLLFMLLKFLSPEILRLLISSDHVYETALRFIDYRSYGIFFVCINYLFRSLYIGVSNTKVISYTTALMATVNVAFNYFLVFGNMGFPELGVEGAAIASVIAEFSAMVFFFVFTFKVFPVKKFAMFKGHKFEFPLLKAIFKIAIPTMLQKLISFGTWLVFFSFVEKMGERPLASTMTVRSGYMMLGIPIYAFGATTNTLVSRLIGEGKLNDVMPTVTRILKLCFISLLPMALFASLAPSVMLNIYTDNTDLIASSINSVYVVVFSAFCLGYGMVFFEAISGTSNTHHGMYLEVIVLLSYIFTAWLTSSYLKLNVEWVWLSEVVYGAILGLLS
ncbi:MAG: MATE family efflux transporter, partial [Rikenellaceae bacterium]